jgi:ribosomal-protein-alanine N-acetyltransferase
LISTALRARRVLLRPLSGDDFEAWSDVRVRCGPWLTKWEAAPLPGRPDPATNRDAFVARCAARQREWQLGTGYGFGIFVPPSDADGGVGAGGAAPGAAASVGPAGATHFAGEINIGTVQRGPFQNAYVGYWIDELLAGRGLMPESVVAVMRFAFEELGLHRLQIAIIPRNTASRRVVEKLDLRLEGVAERYLQIDGAWEDHCRYAITVEEWHRRRPELLWEWIDPRT